MRRVVDMTSEEIREVIHNWKTVQLLPEESFAIFEKLWRQNPEEINAEDLAQITITEWGPFWIAALACKWSGLHQ